MYADAAYLYKWLLAPAQKLPLLENNEDIHAHPCGEYVLEDLQMGVKPNEVVEVFLRLYLVVATEQRVMAYRHYREQRSDYWTSEKLAQLHWEILYGLVPDQLTLSL